MSQTNSAMEKQPTSRHKQYPFLIATFVLWSLVLLSAYYIAHEYNLKGAVLAIFIICFPISTCIFYIGREAITKHTVKALDYVTVLAFIPGILTISEIDTNVFQQKADLAATNIVAIQRDFQERLGKELDNCSDYRVQLNYIPDVLLSMMQGRLLSSQLFNSIVFCLSLSDLRRVDLSRLSVEQVGRASFYSRMISPVMNYDNAKKQTIEALYNYALALRQIEPPKPLGRFISKTVAYLLVAFAFAVRLTRTTLEVKEWHRTE
jgi:hypothetical protein